MFMDSIKLKKQTRRNKVYLLLIEVRLHSAVVSKLSFVQHKSEPSKKPFSNENRTYSIYVSYEYVRL